jgi:hypothetical protein
MIVRGSDSPFGLRFKGQDSCQGAFGCLLGRCLAAGLHLGGDLLDPLSPHWKERDNPIPV